MFTIAFTGHRPKDLWGYKDRAPYTTLCEQIANAIADVAGDHKDVRVITGGAQGVDQVTFWAAEHLKNDSSRTITNELHIPLPNQPSRWIKDGMFGQDEYKKLVKRADIIRRIYEEYPQLTEPVPLLLQRNKTMIDEADAVIAVSKNNLEDALKSRGGTAHAMRYAHDTNTLLAVLDPMTGKLTLPA